MTPRLTAVLVLSIAAAAASSGRFAPPFDDPVGVSGGVAISFGGHDQGPVAQPPRHRHH